MTKKNNKIDDDTLYHKLAKIKELEYFAPFEPIQQQCRNLLFSHVFSCNLQQQQRLFLYIACSDDIEKDNKKRAKHSQLTDLIFDKYAFKDNAKSIKIQEYINKRYYTYLNCLGGLQFTEQDKIKLNSRIQKIKADIRKYKKKNTYTIDDSTLAEIEYMFKLYNDEENKQHNVFKDWNKIFKFENDTELLNFQGCLGLLLMNELCFYYNKKQMNRSILYAMLLTNLYNYSPFSQKWEREFLKELGERREKEKETRKKKSEAGSTTKNEIYKKYCITYMEKNNLSPYHAAEILACEFGKKTSEIRQRYGATIGLIKNKDGKYRENTDYDAFSTIYGWLK